MEEVKELMEKLDLNINELFVFADCYTDEFITDVSHNDCVCYYINENYNLVCEDYTEESYAETYDIICNNELVKLNITKEEFFLTLFDAGFVWIAEDCDGSQFLYLKEPNKSLSASYWLEDTSPNDGVRRYKIIPPMFKLDIDCVDKAVELSRKDVGFVTKVELI